MKKLTYLGTVGIMAAVLLQTPVLAQGGGGQGGAGGPPASRPGSGTPLPDRDQTRDRDRIDAADQDRMRDQDRDRLFLGTQDRIKKHDRDRDGRIDRSEFEQWHIQNFSAFDADQSGGVTLEEFNALRFGPGPGAGGGGRESTQMQERSRIRKTERFRLMDGNGDGAVSRNEYMNFGAMHFLDADANDDGRLTYQELNQYHRGM